MNVVDAPSPPSLELRGVTLSRGERTLFRELSAAVPAGGLLELRGPNGAGKTSLLLAISGVIRLDAGSIDYRSDGEAADLRPASHLLLTQNGLKPRLSVAENLGFWQRLNGADGLAPEPALQQVGLGDLGGIEAGHLSTGQLRRLALARLLVSRRPVWLLDEPTAALDADGEALVAEMLATHCGAAGIAVVATHHDVPLPADIARTTLTIRDGKAELSA